MAAPARAPELDRHLLKDVVARCVALNPEARYASVAELAVAIGVLPRISGHRGDEAERRLRSRSALQEPDWSCARASASRRLLLPRLGPRPEALASSRWPASVSS